MIRGEGGEAEALAADVTREAECAALVAECVKRHGRIDVLHNNVGIGGGDAGPAHVSEEAWDRILAVNLKSVIFPCKHALPVMREQKGGAIMNVSSIAAVCATPRSPTRSRRPASTPTPRRSRSATRSTASART